jgi:hypothetical protein
MQKKNERALVAQHPDATLVELRELFAHQTENWGPERQYVGICRS